MNLIHLNRTNLGIFCICISLLLGACSTLHTSQYSKATFRYENEQPHFYFENDLLGVTGSLWITWAREIPRSRYLPDTIQRILRPISKEHGPVLFTAWAPHQEKYNVASPVKVSKSDVRKRNKYNERFFVIVLISHRPFTQDSTRYIPQGRNTDYQFELFLSPPKFYAGTYWRTEVIAAEKERYFDFVCIMENDTEPDYLGRMFLDDIRTYFSKQ